MNNQVNLRSIDLTIARPTNSNLFCNNAHDFNNSIIATLNGSNAASIHLTLRGDGRSHNPERRFLGTNLKSALIELVANYNLKKAKILLEENGIMEPIDLVADRLFYYTDIYMNGKYPLPDNMWTALRESRENKETELQNYFGTIGNGQQLV